jgi:hypothetical protein
MNSFFEIIESIDSPVLGKVPNINPTVIYNEGWMTRLLVHQSIKEKLVFKGLDFSNISNWTSEALLSSPFIQAKEFREGYTHADIAIGDFDVDFSSRGEIVIRADAKIFGIIEAKMGSNLSQGTTHVSDYNQASRNLVCVASNTYNKPSCKIFFYIVAPEKKIDDHKIRSQIELGFVKDQINNRFNLHSSNKNILKNLQSILDKIDCCDIQALSYEMWISCIKSPLAQNYLLDFYKKSIKWNRL